jgi:hypothetical protein
LQEQPLTPAADDREARSPREQPLTPAADDRKARSPRPN